MLDAREARCNDAFGPDKVARENCSLVYCRRKRNYLFFFFFLFVFFLRENADGNSLIYQETRSMVITLIEIERAASSMNCEWNLWKLNILILCDFTLKYRHLNQTPVVQVLCAHSGDATSVTLRKSWRNFIFRAVQLFT